MQSFEKRVGLHSGVFRIAVVHSLDLPLASPAKLLWSAKVRLAKMIPKARVVCAFNTVPSEVLFGVFEARLKASKHNLV